MEKELVVGEKNKIKEVSKEIALEMIISNAMKIPGVKVDRAKFLAETFACETDDLNYVVENGPVVAGFDEVKLNRIANKLILERTAKSSVASFAMSAPGCLSMAVAIPADIMQFYGITLRLAQELIYLYGSKDLWKEGKVDEEMVRNQLILYCGVMFGVTGASEGVRLLSSQLAITALKKLPQKALTKTFWYPILKKIGNFVGLTVTKKTLANGVTKVIPLIGGVVAGTMTFLSMKSMAERLLKVLEETTFHYTDEEFKRDIEFIDALDGVNDLENSEIRKTSPKKSFMDKSKEKFNSLFKKKEAK